MKIVGIIPERINSSRFPGKPLALICGKPMVQHVYENSIKCGMLDEVYVASGDKEILDCVDGFGGRTIKTRDDHFRASDQTSEALVNLEKKTGEHYDIVCMIQGDEPMVNSRMIEQSLEPLMANGCVNVTNLMGKLSGDSSDSNEIKVVVDKSMDALYFSRCDIPFGSKRLFKQVCIISFKRGMILGFSRMVESDLERLESIDMLRFLDNNIKVRMVFTENETFSVDTPEDLRFVESILKRKEA